MQGTEPVSLTSPALAGGFLTTSATWEALGECLTVKVNQTSSLRPRCLPTLVDHTFRYSEVVAFRTDDAQVPESFFEYFTHMIFHWKL